jgi:hypothetical protein
MIVKKIFVFSIYLIATSISVLAQDQEKTVTTTEKKYARPDIPGTFVLELGLNRVISPQEKFNIGLWGSRALNIYYQYDMRILKSKFSFHPGIGFGLERYKMKTGYIVSYDNNNDLAMQTADNLGLSGLKKSQLITNYLDVPLELRFSTNPEDPTRSFKVAVGVRGGYLIGSHTKIKYSEDGRTVKRKDKEEFNLNKFRYGAFLKVGGGNFSIFGYYNISTVFQKGKGPQFGQNQPKDMTNWTIGISLSSF